MTEEDNDPIDLDDEPEPCEFCGRTLDDGPCESCAAGEA